VGAVTTPPLSTGGSSGVVGLGMGGVPLSGVREERGDVDLAGAGGAQLVQLAVGPDPDSGDGHVAPVDAAGGSDREPLAGATGTGQPQDLVLMEELAAGLLTK